MRHRQLLCTAAVLAAITASPLAQAEGKDEQRYRPYTTTNFYNVEPDFENLDSAVAIGQSAGFPIPGVPGLAIELDLMITLFGGENSGGGAVVNKLHCGDGNIDTGTEPCPGGGGGGGQNNARRTSDSDDFRMFGYGLYLSYATPGKFYVTGKVGAQGFTTTISEIEDEGGGLSWKAGVGYRYSQDTLVELHYFRINSLVDAIGIGLRYGFGGDVF